MKKIQTLIVLLWFSICIASGAESNIKLLHGPYLQNLKPDEVTIVWLSDVASVGWVELAPDDNSNFYATERPRFYDARNGVKNTSTIHSVTLKGLKPGTRYRYRVFAQEVLNHVGHRIIYGYYASTDVYGKKPLTFKTSDPANLSTSFAVVNDIHGNNDLLENLIGKCDLNKTDFVIFNGDMVTVFNEESHIFNGFMDKATKLFASEIPMYYTRGNHETRGAFATEFQRYFSPKEENIYYTFRQGPICFVILDTGEDKPDSDIEYAGITVYDEYRTEQAKWLEQVLNSKEYKEAPFKVIVAHIPPTGGWHGNLEVENKFMPLLREAHPDLMLCGHLHRFIHENATEKTPFPIIINSNTAVLKINADPGKMDIQAVDKDGKTIDQFTIKK